MTDLDVEKQEPGSEEAEEVEVEVPAVPAPEAGFPRTASANIQDPRVVVHGLNKKIEAEPIEVESYQFDWLAKGMDLFWKFLKLGFAILVIVYLLAAFIIDFKRATALFVITVLVVVYHAYYFWTLKNEESVEKAEDSIQAFMTKVDTEPKYAMGFTGFLVLIMVIIVASTVRDGRNMLSLFGMLVFLSLTWLFSWKPTAVMARPVVGSLFIQFIFGYIVIRTSWGLEAMEFLSDIFTTLLGYTVAGSSFVFAWLTDGSLFGRPFQLAPDADGNDMGVYFLGPPFFFNVLPTVIFFSSLMSVGYYIRALPWLVCKLGKCSGQYE